MRLLHALPRPVQGPGLAPSRRPRPPAPQEQLASEGREPEPQVPPTCSENLRSPLA